MGYMWVDHSLCMGYSKEKTGIVAISAAVYGRLTAFTGRSRCSNWKDGNGRLMAILPVPWLHGRIHTLSCRWRHRQNTCGGR